MAGFLGAHVNDWIKDVRNRDLNWFSLSESINDYGHELLLKL